MTSVFYLSPAQVAELNETWEPGEVWLKPGWHFMDEYGKAIGPFPTENQAMQGLNNFTLQRAYDKAYNM